MITQYDSVTLDALPSNATNVAVYVGGPFANETEGRRLFPKARILTIAPQASMDAECLDVEPLDATNAQAPGWFQRQIARGVVKPVLYTSASNVQALINALAAGGIQRGHYLIWSAHYTDAPHVCSPSRCGFPQADGTQWTSHALGRNLDESLLLDGFFGPPPPPPDPNHYRWFQPFELADVKLYDKLRAEQTFIHHPHRAELDAVRKSLRRRAESVYVRTHFDPVTRKPIKPNWALYRRGWRFQQLARRANGKLVAK
jgi:hypothetical protein